LDLERTPRVRLRSGLESRASKGDLVAGQAAGVARGTGPSIRARREAPRAGGTVGRTCRAGWRTSELHARGERGVDLASVLGERSARAGTVIGAPRRLPPIRRRGRLAGPAAGGTCAAFGLGSFDGRRTRAPTPRPDLGCLPPRATSSMGTRPWIVARADTESAPTPVLTASDVTSPCRFPMRASALSSLGPGGWRSCGRPAGEG
jgi:hypothetical protein